MGRVNRSGVGGGHQLKDERGNTRHVAIVERLNKMSMPSFQMSISGRTKN